MTTTIRHGTDNKKMTDGVQKRKALTIFIQKYID